MLKPTHRITAGVTSSHKSTIISVETVTPFVPYEQYPAFELQELFYTEDLPQSLTTRHLAKPYDINLAKGAVRILKVRMPTKKEMIANLQQAGQPIPEDWSKFNQHATATIDYGYVLSGQITLVTGDGTKQDLKTGDFMAQVGAEHTWINDHDEPCIMLVVMLGIESNVAQHVTF